MVSLTNNSANILVENSNEEENESNEENEKEEVDSEEKEEDKKDFFSTSLMNSNFYKTTSLTAVYFVGMHSSFFQEIQLPPPEYNI